MLNLPGRKFPMLRHFTVRPRLVSMILLGIVLWFFLPAGIKPTTRLVMALDTATGLYLIMVAWMMAKSDLTSIERRAATQDDGELIILGFAVFTAVASLVAIVAELATAKAYSGALKAEHIALSAVTVILSWTFMQTMFALHYAHEYYQDDAQHTFHGLEFPGGLKTPDYWDFVYYSFIIGTAAQTADVNILSRRIRRVTTVHCITAFFFNTTILALTVNIGAGLF